MSASPTWRDQLPRLAPAIFVLLPLWQLHDALRPDTIAGQRDEALYTTLYAGAQLRRWLAGVAPMRADLAVGGGLYWPEHPLAAAWQATVGAGVGDGLAYSLLLLVGSCLAGFGVYRWLRARQAPLDLAIAGALLVQSAPLVLRPAVIGELGGLGIGLVALALCGGPVLALAAGLLLFLAACNAGSVPAGLIVLAHGLARRRRAALAALPPLLLALGMPQSGVPGAALYTLPPAPTVAAYVGEGLAVVPLPPAEQEARAAEARAMPDPTGEATAGPLGGGDPAAVGSGSAGGPTRPPDGASNIPGIPGGVGAAGLPAGPLPGDTVPHGPPPTNLPARFPGGLVSALALLLGLALGDRRVALTGLSTLGAGLALIGLLPVLGEPLVFDPGALADWLPGLRSTTGTAGWFIPGVLAAAAALARSRLRWPLWGLVLFQLVAERPLLGPELANIAPEPAELAILSLPPGEVVVFPSPAWPWLQGRRSAAELLFSASRHQHTVDIGLATPRSAALSLWLSARLDLSVDQAIGPLAWSLREVDPFQAAEAGGATALLIDRSQMDEATLSTLEGALARVVGQPIVAHGAFAVHGLRVLSLDDPPEGEPHSANPLAPE